ncbi:MAG: hypothetical protein FWC89_02300 [Defluviitaleaceae bacterium]|nr:hypothetical protein [Defluviitaleaceae bacterium]
MKKSENVICPFCCHRFHPNEADFRLPTPSPTASASANTAPVATGKKKKQKEEIQVDEKLFDYNIDILHLDEREARSLAMHPPAIEVKDNDAVSFEQEEFDKFGFAQRITYKNSVGKKIVADKRLCPNCHNDLPTGYGARDTLLVSILGDARVGKSVYFTVLISELENNLDFPSKLTFIGSKQVRDTFYENYQKPLLRDHELINSTKRRKLPPYSFNYWYKFKNEDGTVEENSIDIIFYDIAGEDLRDEASIRKNGFNIKDSSGLIFLTDPTNFTRLSDLFRFSDSALIEAIPEENSNQQIFNTLYNYFLGFDVNKSSIPLAMVLSKCDLLKFVNIDFFNDKPENRIQHLFKDELHSGAINMRSIKGLNQEVRELLSYLGEDSLLNNAQSCFKHVNCFAVSSLGKKPRIEQISDPKTNETIEKGYVDGDIEPFRVKEAFYWILMRHRLMYKFENNRYSLYSPKNPAEKKSFWQKATSFFTGK